MTDNLAIELKEQFRECYKVIGSFLYFVNYYGYIEDKETSQAIPFKLWQSQQNIISKLVNSLRLIILKARQLGLTWLVACYCLWLAITRPLQLIVVISAKEDWAIEFLDRIKFVLTRLPAWMVPPIAKQTSQILEFVHRDDNGKLINSTIKSLPTTEEGAQSKTPTLLVVDESALNRYFKSIFAASKPGLDVAKGRMIIISNSIKTAPGWPETRKIYQGSMRGNNDFDRIFLNWRARPDRLDNFKKLQLGQGMDEEDFSQHYPENEAEAISLLGGSYFGKALKRHGNDTMEGIKGRLEWDKDKNIQFIRSIRGLWEFWRFPYHLHPDWIDGHDPHWLDRYCIGSDLSQGLGQDYSVLYVMDRVDNDIIARCRTNRLDEDEWGYELYKGAVFFKDPEQPALITPARRGAATAIKRLEKLGFRNFYVRQIPDVTGHGMTRQIGFLETEESKKELAGDLRTYLRTTKASVYDALLLDECSTYIRADNGRLGAEEGHHDDCVVAAACTVQGDLWIDRAPKAVEPDLRPYWLKKMQYEMGSVWTR